MVRKIMRQDDGGDNSNELNSVEHAPNDTVGVSPIRIPPAESPSRPAELNGHISGSLSPYSSTSLDLSDLSGEVSANLSVWASKDQSLTILDWDDTLFPSTWLTETSLPLCDMVPESHPVRQTLNAIAPTILHFIKTAKKYSKVVILTNASQGWVQDACTYWVPMLKDEIEHTRVVYARDIFAKYARNMTRSGNPIPLHLNMYDAPKQWKIVAIRQLLTNHVIEGKCWKNVMGIGDAEHDRDALLTVANRFSPQQGFPDMRVKSIKTPDDPTAQQLQAHLVLLTNRFQSLVNADRPFDLNVDFAVVPHVTNHLKWCISTQENPYPEGILKENEVETMEPCHSADAQIMEYQWAIPGGGNNIRNSDKIVNMWDMMYIMEPNIWMAWSRKFSSLRSEMFLDVDHLFDSETIMDLHNFTVQMDPVDIRSMVAPGSSVGKTSMPSNKMAPVSQPYAFDNESWLQKKAIQQAKAKSKGTSSKNTKAAGQGKAKPKQSGFGALRVGKAGVSANSANSEQRQYNTSIV